MTPSHVRMGTRTMAPDSWLQRDHLAESEIALRRRLLSEQESSVFACSELAAHAAGETAGLVDNWLHERGLSPNRDDGLHPLARAGTSIQEDLCLMVQHDGEWHLEGACLCFPSMWALGEKMGQPARRIHAPVAHYAEELSGRVDGFFNRLVPDKPVRRRNLSLWPACLLWVPTSTLAPELWDPAPSDNSPRLWLRTERQTLRRLPASDAILFSIRVQMAPLSVLTARPEVAGALATWLRGPGGESRRAQLGPLLAPDLVWLDQTAGVAP